MGTAGGSIRLMVLGGALLVASWLILLGLTIRLLGPNLVLALLAFGGSLVGLLTGMGGAFGYARLIRHRNSGP